jgi:hypothetical protein
MIWIISPLGRPYADPRGGGTAATFPLTTEPG